MIYNHVEAWKKKENWPDISPTAYLTFESPNPFNIMVKNATKNWDGTLYFSTDARRWEEWDGTSAIASNVNDGRNAVYMCGTGNSVITGVSQNKYGWKIAGTDIACHGNLETLLDYATVEAGSHPTMGDNCYAYMFRSCTGLTTAPALPATTLSPSCYYFMFQGCPSLTTLPALPATTLAKNCYGYMFHKCTKIKLSPKKTEEYTQEYRIPTSGIGTNAQGAFNGMFAGTGGTFTGGPAINTTYYLSNTNTIV